MWIILTSGRIRAIHFIESLLVTSPQCPRCQWYVAPDYLSLTNSIPTSGSDTRHRSPWSRPLKSLRQPPRARNRQCCFNQLVDICRESVTRVWRGQVMSLVKVFFILKTIISLARKYLTSKAFKKNVTNVNGPADQILHFLKLCLKSNSGHSESFW